MKALLIAALLALPLGAGAQEAPRPVVSEIVTAETARQRAFSGVIEAATETLLGFQTIGRIATLRVDAGDRVTAGDVLATLDQVTLQEDVSAAQAGLDAARAEADFAAQGYARTRQLSDRGIATAAQLEQAEARRDSTAAQVDAAEAQLSRAEDARRFGTLTAPVDGVVLSTAVDPGTVVSAGTPVLTLAGLTEREAVIDVPSDFLAVLPRDAEFEVRAHAEGAAPVPARLRLIEPVADPSLRTRRLRLALDGSGHGLRIGSLVTATVSTEGPAVVTLPQTALAGTPDAPAVWRVTPDSRTVARVPVTLGASVGDRVIVRDGIAVGDENRRPRRPFPDGRRTGRRALRMNPRFNLSDWALHHRSFIWFLMVVSLVAGAYSYMSMGREEDPDFTIKTMIVSAALPGATAEETVTQVTDRIEKKLQELDTLDFTRSVTFPGQAVVYIDLRADTKADEVAQTWIRVRNMMSDIRGEFPKEFAGFSFNDDFGDVFGSIYAFTSDGFSPREMQDIVEEAKTAVLQLDQAGKVELIGTRDQVVHVEFSTRKLAALGLDRQTVLSTLAAQNAIVPSGIIQTGDEQILVRVSGQFNSAEDLAAAPLRAGQTFFTLSDVADVTAGYDDPPGDLFRYNGQEAIGLIIGMRGGGNILDFGEQLNTVMERIAGEMPIGIEIHRVADQPHVVDDSVGHFVRALAEAVVIVLIVSFVSLGMRAGLVVTLAIPLVLAMTFVILDIMGVTLQRISLGALIIALGLLVDDAMIAVETMISRLEIGESLGKAAGYAWTSIAMPMLTGTLVTVAGFIPIALNSSQAGEYTRSLFYVIAVSLVLSWIVAVLFAPVLGATFLPAQLKHHKAEPGRVRRGFHRALRAAMRFKWVTIVLTVLIFGTSLYGMRFVEQQFFPTSDRPEVIVDVTLRQNASFAATNAEIATFETWLATQDEAEYWSTYIGRGAPRFILALDVPTPGPNTGQIVIMTPDLPARDRLKAAIMEYDRSRVGVEFYPKYIELGPPVGKPVQYRVSGPSPTWCAIRRGRWRRSCHRIRGWRRSVWTGTNPPAWCGWRWIRRRCASLG